MERMERRKEGREEGKCEGESERKKKRDTKKAKTMTEIKRHTFCSFLLVLSYPQSD